MKMANERERREEKKRTRRVRITRVQRKTFFGKGGSDTFNVSLGLTLGTTT